MNPNIFQTDLQRKIYLKMSTAQKWEQVCKLRDIAWALKKAAVQANHPEWSSQKVLSEVRKIFLYAVT